MKNKFTETLGLDKLFESLSGAIGTSVDYFYGPTRSKKIAQADAKNIKAVSEAIADSPDVNISYNTEKIEIQSKSVQELAARASKRLAYQETVKQNNIESVIKHAANEFDEDEKVTSEEVETDWILRFISSVEDISNVDLQKLWGKILAGEVKEPQRYSFRTLDILKNLTKKEAQFFKKMSQFIIGIDLIGSGSFIFSNNNLLKQNGSMYGHLLTLEEYGLLSLNSKGYTIDLDKTNKEFNLVYNSKYFFSMTFKGSGSIKMSIPIFNLTNAGNDIYNVMLPTENQDYMMDVFKNISSEVPDDDILCSVYLIKEIYDDGTISYDSENLLADY